MLYHLRMIIDQKYPRCAHHIHPEYALRVASRQTESQESPETLDRKHRR